MHKKSFFAALALGTTIAWGAAAQTFAEQGQVAFGAERLFGVIYTATTNENGPGGADDYTIKSTEIALFGQGGGILTVVNPYSIPRLAFDYFAIDGLSLGGSLIFAHTSLEAEAGNGNGSGDTTLNTFVVQPRVGYAYMFSDSVGIWPRGGITYFNQSTEDDDGDESSRDGLALSFDVPLVLSPTPHFAFLVGPALDLGVAGETENRPSGGGTATTEDVSATSFALYVGLTGYL